MKMSISGDATTTTGSSFDERLIDLIRITPTLFEKGNRMKPYESMKESSETWRSIAMTLGAELNFCMARWKILKDRYRREIAKNHSHDKQSTTSRQPAASVDADDWPLMEKMRFLDKHLNLHHYHSHKAPEKSQQQIKVIAVSNVSPPSTTQQTFAGINYDEPLQEAMDEQPQLATSTQSEAPTPATAAAAAPATNVTSSVLVRIEALLGGLDQINRTIAEKRILSYLCKCQLKALDGESVEHVQL